jgi:hypothetical protein
MKEDPKRNTVTPFLLVHPDLKDDPVQKQGEIGFITAAIEYG